MVRGLDISFGNFLFFTSSRKASNAFIKSNSLLMGAADWKLGIDLRGEDKIALREAVDLVGPDVDANATPGQVNVRVVAVALGDFAHAIDEGQARDEIGKCILFGEVMLVDHIPS